MKGGRDSFCLPSRTDSSTMSSALSNKQPSTSVLCVRPGGAVVDHSLSTIFHGSVSRDIKVIETQKECKCQLFP